MVIRKRTKLMDAAEMVGEELALLLQEDEEERIKMDRRSKSRSRNELIYKSCRSNQEEIERRGEKIFSSVLSNILNDESVENKIESIRSLGKEAIKFLGGKRMSKSRYVGIGGSHSLKAAVRYLQSLLGSKDLEIDLETLKVAVGKNILNLPPGAREKAALQLVEDLKTFPGAEPTKPGSIRWIARLSSDLDPTK